MSDASRLAQLRRDAAASFRAGRFVEAERLIGAALALAPDAPDLLANRGSALAALKRYDEALHAFDRALGADPDFVAARANRATLLFEQKRFPEAASEFDRVLATDPERPYALGNFVLSRLHCCDWTTLAADTARLMACLHEGKRVVPPALSVTLLTSPVDQRIAAEIVARDKAPAGPPLWHGEAFPHNRIRVAYLSSDFHAHATAVLAAGLFEAHDRSRFETFAFSWGPDDGSPMRARLTAAFEHFVDVAALSDFEAAVLIREHEIDIAVDLKGYTSDARPGILARRPAPIQVNYLGFPSTMGAPFIDYIVADRVLVPQESARFYSERILRLPNSYQPNDLKRPHPGPAPTRADERLPGDAFVFCCFNAAFKILPAMFDVWMRVLAQTPGSVLWLLADDVAATTNLKQEAVARGVAPDRLIFARRVSLDKHLARHRLADLFLDTFPYNAHTTASDALWAGLPLVTCMGETFASRVAASVLHAVGLPELVTHSLHDYEALALSLATDSTRHKAIRNKLASVGASPLYDTARTTRDLEWAYAEMVARRRRGAPPSDIDIPIAAPDPG